jgi:regulator of replication initiation timing
MGVKISSIISELIDENQNLKEENKKLKLKLEKCKTKIKFAPEGSGYLEAKKEFYQTAAKQKKITY